LKSSLTISELEFAEKYSKGTIIEASITDIINPSQIVIDFGEGYIGRLSLLNLSWCLPDGEVEFKKYKVGDRIQCVVLDIDFPNQQVILSKKHLSKPVSETLTWDRVERGDEFNVDIIESFNNTTLVKTTDNLYGIINNSFLQENSGRLRVKVNSKLDFSELFSFVPASLDVEQKDIVGVIVPEINFIEDELLSYYNFKSSIFGVYCNLFTFYLSNQKNLLRIFYSFKHYKRFKMHKCCQSFAK